MDPDLTRAYFWTAFNKRLTRLWPRYFLKRFFDKKGKKIKILWFLGEILQTQTKDGWPDQSNKKLTRPQPGWKFLTCTHHWVRRGLENLSNPKFFNFLIFSSKKPHWVGSKNTHRLKTGRPLIYCRSMLASGQVKA